MKPSMDLPVENGKPLSIEGDRLTRQQFESIHSVEYSASVAFITRSFRKDGLVPCRKESNCDQKAPVELLSRTVGRHGCSKIILIMISLHLLQTDDLKARVGENDSFISRQSHIGILSKQFFVESLSSSIPIQMLIETLFVQSSILPEQFLGKNVVADQMDFKVRFETTSFVRRRPLTMGKMLLSCEDRVERSSLIDNRRKALTMLNKIRVLRVCR